METPSNALTIKEVSERLQISEWQVRALITAGKLRAIDTGLKSRHSFRVKPEWVDQFVEESTYEAPQKAVPPRGAKRELLVKRFLTGVVQ